jgi:hypothetical protein
MRDNRDGDGPVEDLLCGAFLEGYQAQVAVTSDQLIVAVQVRQSPNEQRCFTR